MKLETLTPKEDIEISAYKDSLDYAFGDKRIKNIAITGPYSSGKSSVLNTYEGKSCKKFIKVSLAHFSDEDKESLNSIENDILKQIIFQIKDSIVSDSGFRLINMGRLNASLTTAGIFFCFFTYGLFNGYVDQFLDVWYLEMFYKLKNYFLYLSLFVISVFLYKICRIISNGISRIKITIGGNQIELENSNKDKNSLFDKYLSEMVFIFTRVKTLGVVFEDIDRFNRVDIFERLRTLNIIINNKRPKNKPIKFVYLIRDDLFSSEDRVKFFDLIVPVIPYTHSSNSLTIFKDHSGFKEVIEEVDEVFLERISIYLDDPRIINNLLNEYLVYRQRFFCSRLLTYGVSKTDETKIPSFNKDSNKLLAIIVYKNIFPTDFAKLLKGEGFVFKVLEKMRSDDCDFNPEWQYEVIGKTKLERDYFKSVTENQKYLLLVYLLSREYIYFDYYKYISYYRSFVLSESDKKFVICVDSNFECKFDYKIENSLGVVQHLNNFRHIDRCRALLNFSLLDFLLENYEDNALIKEALENYISNMHKCMSSIDPKDVHAVEVFSKEYIERGKNRRQFELYFNFENIDLTKNL